jgi:hypothetical protein
LDLSKPLTFDAGDEDHLAVVLGCKPDEVKDKLVGHAQAALNEYINMYLGRRAPTQAREFLEQRLALLMTYAITDGLPTDDQAARLFNLTRSQARTLIRNTISKHRFQLQDVVVASARTALEQAAKAKDGLALTIRSVYLAEWLNQGLDRLNEGHPPLTPIPNQVSRYLAWPSSYEVLCVAYGAKPVKA